MLARIRKAQEGKESGFTLIELLVVMIIIGILAAIAIPAFLNQKAKARDTSAKADVATIGKEITAYYVDGSGGLTVSSSGSTWSIVDAGNNPVTSGPLSAGNAVESANVVSDTTFCVAVQNGTNGKIYNYTQTGLGDGTCP